MIVEETEAHSVRAPDGAPAVARNLCADSGKLPGLPKNESRRSERVRAGEPAGRLKGTIKSTEFAAAERTLRHGAHSHRGWRKPKIGSRGLALLRAPEQVGVAASMLCWLQ